MRKMTGIAAGGVLMLGAAGVGVAAQQPPSPATLIKAERAAMAPLKTMAGIWRGKASMTLPSGRKTTITQTERVGPFLGGSVMMMEGRGYDANGTKRFNALGIISYDPAKKAYTMRAYAQGHAGNFPLTLTDHGFKWDIKAGPATMHYTATIKQSTWHEVGVRELPNGKQVKFFEMTLKHVGDTDWPGAGAVPFKPKS
jgi:hypothetical protein